MRLRSIVLPAAVACAAAVLAPAPAQAAASQCGLIVPTKVVINAEDVDTHITLTSGCYSNQADHANWDYVHPGSGYLVPNDFTAADLAEGPDWIWTWSDDAPMGRWVSDPTGAEQADGDPLTQNTAVTQVKYASKVATSVTRTSTGLSWAATATQWSGRSHKYVARPKVNVGLFHQATTSSPWTYVKSATTTSTGKATVTMGTTKSGNYRLMVAETPTVWASYSNPVKGRI